MLWLNLVVWSLAVILVLAVSCFVVWRIAMERRDPRAVQPARIHTLVGKAGVL